MMLRVADLINDSIVDGPGFRYAVYTQGCSHNCKGCHNPGTHSFDGGRDIDIDDIMSEIEENPLLSGVTFSGGDPLFQPRPLISLAKRVKDTGLNIWCYTGWTWEALMKMNDTDILKLLEYVDVLVDGPFVLEKRTLELPFRGSSNQRLIDVERSLKNGFAVLFEL